jgi:hypothetical protein
VTECAPANGCQGDCLITRVAYTHFRIIMAAQAMQHFQRLCILSLFTNCQAVWHAVAGTCDIVHHAVQRIADTKDEPGNTCDRLLRLGVSRARHARAAGATATPDTTSSATARRSSTHILDGRQAIMAAPLGRSERLTTGCAVAAAVRCNIALGMLSWGLHTSSADASCRSIDKPSSF